LRLTRLAVVWMAIFAIKALSLLVT